MAKGTCQGKAPKKKYQWLAKIPAPAMSALLEVALEGTFFETVIYTPERYEDMLRGMADSSLMLLGNIKRINLFPELIRASCSLVGAWGPATADGGLL